MIADVAETVEEPVEVLAVAVSFPLLDEEVSSPAVIEAVGVELVVVGSIEEVESSCRGSGRATPAKTTLRHSSRAKIAQIRWVLALVLILCRRTE